MHFLVFFPLMLANSRIAKKTKKPRERSQFFFRISYHAPILSTTHVIIAALRRIPSWGSPKRLSDQAIAIPTPKT